MLYLNKGVVFMINNYIGKKVRILVSSGSGAGAISADERYSNGVMTSIINFCGELVEADDKFVKLLNVTYTLYSLDTEVPIGFSRPINIETPVFESDSTIININSIIAILLI